MSFTYREDEHTLYSEHPAGLAGTASANIGRRIIAEVDIAAGTIVAMTCSALAMVGEMRPVIYAVAEDEEASDAVRRLVFATAFEVDEPWKLHEAWLLDRVTARLDLESRVAAMHVSANDAEVARAVDILVGGAYAPHTERGEMLMQRCVDVLKAKTGDERLRDTSSYVEPLLVSAGIYRAPVDVSLGSRPAVPKVPHLVLLSEGLDLAVAESSGRLSGSYKEAVFHAHIGVENAGHWDQQFDAYLIDPGAADPVLAASRVRATGSGLVTDLLVSGEMTWDQLELVIVPRHGSFSDFAPTQARALIRSGIMARTAVRLSHQRSLGEAEKRLEAAEKLLRDKMIPQWYRDRLAELRARLADDPPESGLLADE